MTGVSDGLRLFLATRIDTFEKLEVMIALAGAPDATMTTDQLSNAVRLPSDVVRETIAELHGAQLVEVSSAGAIQVLAQSQGDRACLDELLDLYASSPLTVMRVLNELAMDRVRNMASRTFAEA